MVSNEEIERLKEIFVTRKECEKTRHDSDDHIQRLEIAMAKVGTKLSIMIGILGAIGVAILSVVVKFLFGG